MWLLSRFQVHHISLKFREENEVGLVFWTGPRVALEILRLWEYSGGKIVEYICIVVIVIAFKMAEGQTGGFNVEIVDAVGTTNLE